MRAIQHAHPHILHCIATPQPPSNLSDFDFPEMKRALLHCKGFTSQHEHANFPDPSTSKHSLSVCVVLSRLFWRIDIAINLAFVKICVSILEQLLETVVILRAFSKSQLLHLGNICYAFFCRA